MSDIRDELNRAEALAIGELLRREAPTPLYAVDPDTGKVDRLRVETMRVRHRDPARMAALDAAGNGYVTINRDAFDPALHELVDAEGEA